MITCPQITVYQNSLVERSFLRIQQTCHNCLFLLTSYVALDYHFEQAILSTLNLHVLVQ